MAGSRSSFSTLTACWTWREWQKECSGGETDTIDVGILWYEDASRNADWENGGLIVVDGGEKSKVEGLWCLGRHGKRKVGWLRPVSDTPLY